MTKKQGFTVLEMLISLTILLVVLALTSKGILMVMKVQSTQEATATAQAKLRRTSEVFEGMLRASVVGGLAEGPYLADDSSVSFASLKGGSGYQVATVSSGLIEVYAANLTAADFISGQALLVDANGEAVVVNVNAVSPAGANKYSVQYANCANIPAYTNNMQLHSVEMLGFDYDSAHKLINVKVANKPELALAFNISEFEIKYVYIKQDGTAVVLNAPLMDINGVPQKRGSIGGDYAILRRLELTITTLSDSYSGRQIERTYSSLINIGDQAGKDGLVNLKGIKSCI